MRQECLKCNNWNVPLESQPCRGCLTVFRATGEKPMYDTSQTEGERIREMSDEELATFIVECIIAECPYETCELMYDTDKKKCSACWLGWLRRKAEND